MASQKTEAMALRLPLSHLADTVHCLCGLPTVQYSFSRLGYIRANYIRPVESDIITRLGKYLPHLHFMKHKLFPPNSVMLISSLPFRPLITTSVFFTFILRPCRSKSFCYLYNIAQIDTSEIESFPLKPCLKIGFCVARQFLGFAGLI